MHDNLKQIADVRRMKDVQRLFDEEEDEDCRVFAAAKKKMMRLRRREGARDSRGEAAQPEPHQGAPGRRARSQAQRRGGAAVQRGRTRARRLAAEAAEQKQRDMEMVRARREADELFQQRERQRAQEKLAEERRRADLLASQARNRETEAQKAKQAELEYEAANLQLLEQEEEQFQSYATKVIDHCERGGRNTLPLRKAAKAGAGGGLGPQLPAAAASGRPTRPPTNAASSCPIFGETPPPR
uniref:TPH domain-containing protein n=1 Tax=Macrostomum lignano TaxID=282301 RepID=A0A1I8FFN0_9PLAT